MIAISAKNIRKIYPLYKKPIDRLKETLHPLRKTYHTKFNALQDINFEIKKGDTVGILGQNGSGKSTLLKIITGVLTQTSGTLSVNGTISSLLELGTGFNPELNGMENIYFYGAIQGLYKEQIEERVESICSFADIGDFIYQPVKSYSSGMFVRLAFACAIHVEPDILIIDEALSVGDAKFQAKCFSKLSKLMKAGVTILFVSHSTEQIITHCNHAILLEKGRIYTSGEPKTVVNTYLDLLFGKKKDTKTKKLKNIKEDDKSEKSTFTEDLNSQFEKRPYYNPSEYRWGDREAEIIDFVAYQDDRLFPSAMQAGIPFFLKFRFVAKRDLKNVIFGFAVKTKEGITVYNTNSDMQGLKSLELLSIGEERILEISMPIKLFTGDYFLSLGLVSKNEEQEIIPHDRRYDSIHIVVEPVTHFFGLVDLDMEMKVY
ncbi:MAG: ABC transporter ATP-binding protein [Leptospiraceae bacterium]|nr:ABC transporter ATP-binding protein [Leptospiraceae bacterium]MCP5498259.1 ABC transporter ATP-binding protein [Leptospiraceae bacterium]